MDLCVAGCLMSGRTNGFYRAHVSTRTTVNAFIWIDFIDITFGYCLGGTFGKTGTTGRAVVTNYISHSRNFIDLYRKNNALIENTKQKITKPA